jgi:hypothetical protein
VLELDPVDGCAYAGELAWGALPLVAGVLAVADELFISVLVVELAD